MAKQSNQEGKVSQNPSAGSLPSIWTPEFINSFSASCAYELHGTKLDELNQNAKRLLATTNDPPELLKLIDSIQRLGVGYHFETEIKEALHAPVYHYIPSDLYNTALRFRLLRENGFPITSDVFDKFRYEDGKFMDNLGEDVLGLLSLYEASYLGMDGEEALEEAKIFSIIHLKLLKENLDSNMAEQVQQSLEVPIYRRMPRVEARTFIDVYKRDNTKSLTLLELAELDYNILQSLYLMEIKDLAKWWWGLNFKEKLPFARDRFLECYFWAMGCLPEPQFFKGRRYLTKYCCIAATVDDVYDVYGTLDELERFTDALNRYYNSRDDLARWDIKAVEGLPEYMKTCYSAIHDSTNEMVEEASKDIGMDVLPYIKEQWQSCCTAMLKEARWTYNGYMPNFDEYLKNALVTVGIAPGLVHAYVGVGDSIAKYLPDCFQNWSSSELFYLPCLISRLYDDLTTSQVEKERCKGESVNSVQCYMVQEGVSEEKAREHIKGMLNHAWKRLNNVITESDLPRPILKATLALTRCVHRIYQYGDWFSVQSEANKDCGFLLAYAHCHGTI